MNRKALIFFAAFTLIATGAGLLLYLKAHQRLGSPAVRVVTIPLYDETGKRITDNSVFLPELVADATSKLAPVTVERKTLPRDTTLGKRIYSYPDGFEVLSSVVLMGNDRTSLHKPEICVIAAGWSIDSTQIETVKVKDPVEYELPVTKLRTSLRTKDQSGQPRVLHGVYVYWFVADGQMTARHDERMIWMAKRMLTTGVLDRWAYVSCFALSPDADDEATFARMKQFIASSVPQFQLVPKAQEGKSAAIAKQ